MFRKCLVIPSFLPKTAQQSCGDLGNKEQAHLKLTVKDMLKNKLIDGIIAEPLELT
jgi:hypothetical protein